MSEREIFDFDPTDYEELNYDLDPTDFEIDAEIDLRETEIETMRRKLIDGLRPVMERLPNWRVSTEEIGKTIMYNNPTLPPDNN